MIKQCFTDGLISIAIVLSLLRTDLSSYLNSNYITYPEVQEIILGTSTAYGRVNYNNNRDLLSNLGRQHVRLKNIDYGRIFSTSLYRELRQLTSSSFQERDYYSTYLVSADHVSSSNPGSSSSSHVDNTNEDDDDGGHNDNDVLYQDETNEEDILATASAEPDPSPEDEEGEDEEKEDSSSNDVEYHNLINTSNNLNSSPPTTKEPEVDEGAAVPPQVSSVLNKESVNSTSSSYNSTSNNGTSCSNASSEACSDLTKEDLDLIDVLYRQDIDLGVQREVYDVNLRRELERDQELALQKEREKHKQLELHQLKLQEDQRQLEQQWLMENYTRDTETGEWIPIQQPQPLQHCNYANVSQVNVTEPQPLPLQPTTSNNQSDLALQTIPLNHNIQTTSLEEALQTLDIESRKNVGEEPALEHYLDNYLIPNQMGNFSVATAPDQLNGSSPFGCNLLPCPSNTTNTSCADDQSMNVEYYQEQPPPPPPLANVYERQNSLDNWWREIMGSSSETSVENPSHSRELIQNATLPLPAADLGCGTIFNTNLSCNSSASLNASSCQSSEWDNQNMLFPNITTAMNESSSLMEIEKMLRGNTLMGNMTLPNINLEEGVSGLMDDGSSDSAVCSLAGSASPFQEFSDSNNLSPYDPIEGATGGSDYDSSSSSTGSASGHKDVKTEPTNSTYYGSYGSSGGQQMSSSMNHSTSSNDSDFNYQPSNTNHVQHNHTYSQQQQQQQQQPNPPPQKSSLNNQKSLHPDFPPGSYKSSKSSGSHCRGPTSRDTKRLREMNVPLSTSEIIDSSVEEFNELVRKYPLPESHLRLVRDIRRRGKNKVAAQNCRKRKLDVIGTLEEEVINMREARNRLLMEGNRIEQKTREMKEKYKVYYQEVFASLRDEFGNPYDPQEYSLQQSSDGNVFLVRKGFASEEKSLDSNRKKKTEEK